MTEKSQFDLHLILLLSWKNKCDIKQKSFVILCYRTICDGARPWQWEGKIGGPSVKNESNNNKKLIYVRDRKRSVSSFPLTISIKHHETRHHEDRVPVKLQKRSIPCKSSSPGPTPQTHKHHAQKPKPHAQQIEEHRETHLKQRQRKRFQSKTCIFNIYISLYLSFSSSAFNSSASTSDVY